jgi:dienelactone hydrolase
MQEVITMKRILFLALGTVLSALAFLFVPACMAKEPTTARVVTLTASDGTELKATYFAAAKPGPGILLFHQCNRDRKVWNDLAQGLTEAGFNVLALDFRGFGESGGTPLNQLTPQQGQQMMNRTWADDVDRAFQYLVSQAGVMRNAIGAGGASCGVNQAVQLARRHPEVKALVLLSEGTNRQGRDFLRNSTQPALFLAAADDDPDPGVVEIMQWLLSLSSNPVNKFERYATGGHGIEMFAAHQELPAMIVNWLRTTLTHPSRGASVARAASIKPHLLDLTDQPGGAGKLTKMLEGARQHDPKAVLFSELVVNRIGYEHLIAGDTKDAVEIFKLNVAAYPSSPNVYDSLSDGYLADGLNDLARQNAKQALELLPSDTTDSEQRRNAIKDNAMQKLKQLGDML